MRVATLNIWGYGPPLQSSVSDKWIKINQVVRDNNIAILALQESHLTLDRIETLNRVFASSLLVAG